MLAELQQELQNLADPKKAKDLARYFKTSPGEYGEGDRFLGVTGSSQRKLARKYRELSLPNLQVLLSSPWHEHRQVALFILVLKYPRAKGEDKQSLIHFYLKNLKSINNWDLVDCSAPHLLGDYFLEKDKAFLYRLARSKDFWCRRIAVLSTFGFIRKNQFADALQMAELLLRDQEDLIHKAVGWMLREIGNRNRSAEEAFLLKHYRQMPRTMLRYALEKFPEKRRQFYLKK
jgi:3-methyladenine DNA glycosylase AlkD